MTKMVLNKLDKSNWKSVPFEKIASKISETVNPNNTELEIYVGLEHIDTEDIHIRRFGVPSDVSGGKLKCYPGDVIFGKRRAYQRKAAIVDFEGICSAHAFVFRANPDLIDPKLFPFFLHSDQFMHRMVDISVGGLSPTINWGDLKHQEFLLPPKEEQAKLAELLWAMDEVIERETTIVESMKIVSIVNKEKILIHEVFKKQWNLTLANLGELCDVIDPHPSHRAPKAVSNGLPFIGIGDVDENGEIDLSKVRYISEEDVDKQRNTFVFEKGDIGFGRVATIGKVVWLKEQDFKYAVSPTMSIIKPKNQNPDFIYELLKTDYVRNQFERMITGSTRQSVGIQKLRTVQIPVVDIKDQEEIIKIISTVNATLENAVQRLKSSKALQKCLINQVF
jgi:restriction endonuclease S subunit